MSRYKQLGLTIFLIVSVIFIFFRYGVLAEENLFQNDYLNVEIKPKQTVVVNSNVSNSDKEVIWYISWEQIDVKLVGPDGHFYQWKRELDPMVGIEPVFVFRISDPQPGKWSITLKSKSTKSLYAGIWKVTYSGINFVPAWNEAERVSEPVIKARLFLEKQPISKAYVTAKIKDAVEEYILLKDDGFSPDNQANDGIYTGSFPGKAEKYKAGRYVINLFASGNDPNGQSFKVYNIGWLNFGSPAAIKLINIEQEIPYDADGNGRYEKLIIPVTVEVSKDGTFMLEAVLCCNSNYCREKSDKVIKLGVGRHEIPLSFNMSKFTDLKTKGPYSYTIKSLYIYQNNDMVYAPGDPQGETGYSTREYPRDFFE